MTERRWNSGRRLALAAAAAGVLAQAAAANDPDAIAVIVGNAEYREAPWNVPTAAADARAVAEFATRRLGFDEDRVFVVNDATGTDLDTWFGTRARPKGKLHDLVRAGRSDVLVFYAGHGMPDLDSERGYLLPTDADPDRIALGGYEIDLLLKNLEALPARSVLVALDACFSGLVEGGSLTGGRGMIEISPKPVQRARMAVLTAASGRQVAYTDPDSGHGVFTDQLLAGLGGAADRGGDGKVTLDELETWLAPAVSRRVREINGREQTPTVDGDGAMVLAALPSDTLTIRAAQPGARVRVDGAAYRAGMPLGRGEHEVTVEAQGYEPFRRALAVDGQTEYRIDLCRVESRMERICEDEEVVRYDTEIVKETDEVYVQKRYRIDDLTRMQIAQMQLYGASRSDILYMLCTPRDRDNPNWIELMGELEDECEDDLDGRLRRRTADLTDCDCEYDFSYCETEAEAECTYEIEEEVPYTEIRQVCRDEPREKEVCPTPIVERLR